MRSPLRVAVSAITLAAMLTACDSPGLGGSDPADTTETATESDPDSTATMPTEVPSWLLECGSEEENKDGTDGELLQLADIDLTTATWATPSEFEVTTGYYEDNRVETIYSTWYAVPTNPPMETLNVANVVIYTGLDWGDLADECGRVPIDAIEEKLAEYRDEIDARPQGEATRTEVAGYPAIAQDIELSLYSYTGIWLFSQDQVMHIYCQWTNDANRPTLERGCEEIIASVSVG